MLIFALKVEVKVAPCADLSQAPWGLAGKGLSGNRKLVDIGGEFNLFYHKNHGNTFHFDECAKLAEIPKAFMIGPGAGSRAIVGKNCELIANVNVGEKKFDSYIAKMTDDDKYVQEKYAENQLGILCNLLACDGAPGDAIYFRAKARKGEQNLVSCLREGLRPFYTPKGLTVGLGGAFRIKSGKIKAHIMPDFLTRDMPITEVKDWLRFFEFEAPFTCVSVFLTEDINDLNLRLEHTHFFSDHNQAGHYHYDTTPDEVEYEGYFVPAEQIFRVGQPYPNPSC
eukprot:Phypoly_transcript_07031.p1 GENE.Phypoly_transcript_07031~~Phypoly_transcript_07031.p1  ORF type:complete len:282 (-),score=36.28 Phypoly_transcript_07031:88-933(-)